MRKKMLISLALVVIMLFNCIAPLMQVQAATTVETITLNSALYDAVKEALTEKNVPFAYDNNTLSIGITTDVLATITEMSLNEKNISNLEGLEKFSSLTTLDLSGNMLSEESSLETLNSLTQLNHLDLSTNNIGDITPIKTLISNIESNEGKVVLTSQYILDVNIFEKSEAKEVEIQLPLILEKAGYIKEEWIKELYKEELNYESAYIDYPNANTPYIKKISEENSILKSITVNLESTGLLKFVIEIKDNSSTGQAGANMNQASKNPLKDSVFETYIVVHDEESTGIHIPDINLYNEIKKQLTAGQKVNSELASYPYEVDINNEIVYEDFSYELVNANYKYLNLTVLGEENAKYRYYPDFNYFVEIASNEIFYNVPFEIIQLETKDDNGNIISTKEIYRVAILKEKNTLYKAAYDDPQVLVITDKDLMNKITSLILDHKEIRDLTGIEYFVGLKSDLNVSSNYLENINPIYKLQENKDIFEKELQEKYNKVLNSDKINLSGIVEEITQEKESADNNRNSISEAVKQILEAFKSAAMIEKYKVNEAGERILNEEYEKSIKEAADNINQIIKTINGYEEEDTVANTSRHIDGYYELLDKNLENASAHLGTTYGLLKQLYDIYNDEYKLLTFLTDEMNYIDLPEYLEYEKALESKETAAALLQGQMNYVAELVNNKTLTELEKRYIKNWLMIDIDSEEEDEFAKYIEKFDMDNYSNVITEIGIYREMALYSEIANYCLIKRMEEALPKDNYCYAEEYLLRRIKDFKLEGIPTEIEEKVLEYIRKDSGTGGFNIYKGYREELCRGEYYKIEKLDSEREFYESAEEIIDLLNLSSTSEEATETTLTVADMENNVKAVYDQLGGRIIKAIKIFEMANGNRNEDLDGYNQVITLAKRLVAGNVERYVTLPELKKLDISNNAHLGGIERLGELSYLRELQANRNYITKIDFGWEGLKYLRKLGLADNFITDITPLDVLENIVELDVSKNLLSGAFEFDFTNCQKTLQFLDLSHNQLEDIIVIQRFIDRKSGGNYANYLAQEDTINIDLGYQDIVIELEDPILLNNHPTTVDIDLPKIFTQLIALDVERTSLGNTSLDGRIESEGRFVTLNTNKTGERTGVVEILKVPNAETCVGIGTKATIKYTVGNRVVNSVKINEQVEKVQKGTTQIFTVTVDGECLSNPTQPVYWTIEGALSTGTTIDQNGMLTVGADETATSIKVVATAIDDITKKDEKTIAIFAKSLTSVVINEQAVSLDKGESATFTVTITGENLEDADKAITWTVEGGLSTATKIENGVLTVGADETATTLTVKATSNYDNTKNGTSTVTVAPKVVTGVTVTGNATAKAGETVTFTATVAGENLSDADKTVSWEVTGATSPYTRINKTTGELVIASNEEAEVLVVAAVSNYDNTKVGTAEIKLVVVRNVTVESTSNRLNNGNSMTLTAKVEGSNLTDAEKAVTWEVIGAVDATTVITEAGVLTIGANETATKVTVKATSVTNPSIFGEKEIKIDVPLPTLGYTVEGGDTIVDVKTTTTAANFKAKFITDTNYTVEIRRNGTAIEDTANVATGDIVVLKKNGKTEPEEAFEVIIKGDVNGDGIADSLDSSLIKAHRARLVELTGLFLDAADINNDNEITVNDTKLLLYHRARIEGYIL